MFQVYSGLLQLFPLKCGCEFQIARKLGEKFYFDKMQQYSFNIYI